LNKQKILCNWHLCNVYIFAIPDETGGSDIIDTVCPVCWVEEKFQGAAVTDLIHNGENDLVGLVFDHHQVLYLNQPHGIDQGDYVPGDELASSLLKIEFASMASCRRTNWSLFEVPEIEKQIRGRLLDEHPD
jgi:hypothetical protein